MKNKLNNMKGIPNGVSSNSITNISSTWYYFPKRLTKKTPNLSSTKCFGVRH